MEVVDYFGSLIEIGDRGIRVDIGFPNQPFKQFVVVKLNSENQYSQIGIRVLKHGMPSKRMSWASSSQVITEKSFIPNLYRWETNTRFKLQKKGAQ